MFEVLFYLQGGTGHVYQALLLLPTQTLKDSQSLRATESSHLQRPGGGGGRCGGEGEEGRGGRGKRGEGGVKNKYIL